MKIYYQISWQLGSAGKMRNSFTAALCDLNRAVRAAVKSRDVQAIYIRKFNDRFSDFSEMEPWSEGEIRQAAELGLMLG